MTGHERRSWTFLTNHALGFVAISQNPIIRAGDVAPMTGFTERSTQRIVAELEEAGRLSHETIGRRNLVRDRRRPHLRRPANR